MTVSWTNPFQALPGAAAMEWEKWSLKPRLPFRIICLGQRDQLWQADSFLEQKQFHGVKHPHY
jgi:hypothetical protein